MATPNALVLTGYGINCDNETEWALKKAGADADRVHINDLIDRKGMLRNYQMLVFPGGFSFGDDISAGKVFAETVKANLEQEIMLFIWEKKLIFGFCNGFQVMVKMGLLPGFDGNYMKQTVTLAANDSNQYEDRWVYLTKPEQPKKPAQPGQPEQPVQQEEKCVLAKGIYSLYVPVAHGEGKFIADSSTIEQIERNKLVVFRYSIPDGENPIPANGRYPENPNGSVNDIAGLCDPSGLIFGMMPHPERFLHFTNHPEWTMLKEQSRRMGLPIPKEGEGMKIFRNAVKYFK